jgi:hypothetical protein
MQFFLKIIMPAIIVFFSMSTNAFEVDENYKSDWAGIEVIGGDIEAAEKIRSLDLVTIGATFPASKAKHYCQKCKKIVQKKTQFTNAHCSLIWYGDQTAYLIVETGGKHINDYLLRSIPKNKYAIVKIPDELNKVFLLWESRMSVLMFSSNNKKLADLNDPILHKLTDQLYELVPKYNQAVLDVVHYSPDKIERQKAAQLFAWSNHAENLPYVLEWDLLLDPDSGVRNDVARSFSNSMEKIKDETLLKNLMPVYCKQLSLPTFSDRNKALMSISRMLQTHPILISTLNKDNQCKANITYISNMSILENVREPAKDILKILDTANHA